MGKELTIDHVKRHGVSDGVAKCCYFDKENTYAVRQDTRERKSAIDVPMTAASVVSPPNSKAKVVKVHLSKDYMKFDAAHFIACKADDRKYRYDEVLYSLAVWQGFREKLHGHNYRLAVTITGQVGSDGYVLDLGEIKRISQVICKDLNEAFLVPMKSDALKISGDAANVHIITEDMATFRYDCENADCSLLPIVHSSAEELAVHIVGSISLFYVDEDTLVDTFYLRILCLSGHALLTSQFAPLPRPPATSALAAMKFTNKDLYYLLFTELSPNQARCNTCLKVYKSGNGYTNQVHRLLKRHPDYQELPAAAFRKGNRFGVTLPDQRTCDLFRWVEWCVMDHMPVSFCERPLVRKNAKMEPISAATLQKYLDALYGHVREMIATTLPDKFGITLDALTTGGRHYFAIMATFDDPSAAQPKQRNPKYDESIQCLACRFVLLALCPLGNEEDLSAQSLFDFIPDTLSTYNGLNQAIGRKVGALPFIGCASHRFQLAVNDFLADKELLLAKIHALMKDCAPLSVEPLSAK
ncbi:6-pyruvoyl tetrahydropterin synthase/QueD family protein [Phytophthora cactorum]|nr:6-pyruvoyl tetrahydropterin synthase/QueD family protein [Phytophthora cactorum]